MPKNKNSIDFEDLVAEVRENAYADRAKANELLSNFEKDFESKLIDSDKHAFIGRAIGEYLEIRSRANEQLVKLASILQREKENKNKEDDEVDITNIYDKIEN